MQAVTPRQLEIDKDVEAGGVDPWNAPELDIITWKQFLRKPRKYEDWMPEAVYNMYVRAKRGLPKKGIARRLGITEAVLHDWIRRQGELSIAIRAGEALQEERLVGELHRAKYTQGTQFQLMNLHHWSTKTDERTVIDFAEAKKRLAASAERVDWDQEHQKIIEGQTAAPAAPPVNNEQSPNTPS